MKDDRAIDRSKSPDSELSHPANADNTITFVMVLRLESTESENDTNWRWNVKLVETGVTGSFHRIDDVIAFIVAVSGMPGPR